ncbi:ABC transporter permease [Mycobacterium sp. NPDC003323]
MTSDALQHSRSEPVPDTQRRSRGIHFGQVRDLGVLGAVVALFLALALTSPAFLSLPNLMNVATQWAPVGIMALGASAILLTAGFDLSTGAMYVVAGIAAVTVAAAGSVPLGIVAGIVTGTVLGAINGVLGTYGRMNVFVATLATSIVFGGAAVAVTGGTVQIATDPDYAFALARPLGVTVPVWCFLAVVVATWFIFSKTTTGRYLYATGGNEEAARLAGIRTRPVRLFAFVFAGMTAGISAVLVSSGSMSAGTSSGTAMAYNVWTAMLIGGNSMAGGEGAVWRTVAGVALLALLQNGFNLLGVEPLYQQIATGLVLLLAIGVDAWARRVAR